MSLNSRVLSLCLDIDLQRSGLSCEAEYPGMSVKARAALALRQSFLKKYEDEAGKDAERAATSLFLEINESLKTFEVTPESLTDEYLLGEFRREVYAFVSEYVLDQLTSNSLYFKGRVGPGASVGANGYDFYTKLYSSALTCTGEGLYLMYKAALAYDSQGKEAEETRASHLPAYIKVQGSRLSCVPKSTDIARTICTEPTLNMFFQLGLGAVIEDGLLRAFGISFTGRSKPSFGPGNLFVREQPYGFSMPDLNRRMAAAGSRTGRFSTIDLKSASDSISLGLLKWCLPANFLNWLMLLRSPVTEVNGKSVELNMISTMGNGFTFPLQTMLFACVVKSAYTLSRIPLIKPRGDLSGNFGVFGDDIVCESSAYHKIVRLLNLLGFKVNVMKSFFDGDFRESCGHDYYRGVNIRGVYVKTLRTTQDRLAVMNRLIEWSATHDIELRETLSYLRAHTQLNAVPVSAGYDEGLRVPFALAWGVKENRNLQSHLYWHWDFRTPHLEIRDERIHVPRGAKRRVLNPAGLHLAFLHGSLRDMKISMRPSGRRGDNRSLAGFYIRRRSSSSCWDYYPDDPVKRADGWWQRWFSVVASVCRETH